jgi:hypothetical protein
VSEEIWERHPVYPHEGSSLGRIRTLDGLILSQRPHNRPRDAPPEGRYRKADIWVPGRDGSGGRKVTILVHQFITECHWGPRPYRRAQARHGPRGPADNSWANLRGWGPPELNNGADKPREVRIAAARKARAAQLAARPRRHRRRRWHTLAGYLPWRRRRQRPRPVTAGPEPVPKPVTKEGL